MNDALSYQTQYPSIRTQVKKSRLIWLLLFGAILSASLVLSLFLLKIGPDISVLGWVLYVSGIAAIIYRPRWGIYLVLFFALTGDGILVPWYPFIKNFSSAESIFYLNDSLIFSPLETYLALTLVSWLARSIYYRKLNFYFGSLIRPAAVFFIFTVIGLMYGISKGGDFTIALWEFRPFAYLFLMIVLSSNLFTHQKQYNQLMMWVTAALVIEGIIGVIYIFTTAGGHLTSADGITEHSASIHMNTVFILVVLAWLYQTSAIKRLVIPLGLPFMVLTYIASQRRAAFISIAVALLLIACVLYFENRRLFWILIPPLLVAGAIYIAIFWNSTSSLGFPAQAIKSVVAQNSASTRDQLSNGYRVVENLDTGYTIHQHPIFGIGFGNKFYTPIALPDISFFVWWNYLPHNSIIYVWLKAGLGGFIAMLYFIGISILTGVKAFREENNREVKIILLSGALYIVMHFLYAYVDISWDAQSMLYLGAVIGMLNTAGTVARIPETPIKNPYPWQTNPTNRSKTINIAVQERK